MGLAYPPLFQEATTFLSFFKPANKFFALELRKTKRNGFHGFLSIGGYNFSQDTSEEQVEWGEAQMWRANWITEHEFSLYHLSICGVDLMEAYSSQLRAEVVTGSACLFLPRSLWEYVMRWLGAECFHEEDSPRQPSCVLSGIDPSKDPHKLPPISFQLSEGGKLLSIPLTSLFENTKDQNTNKFGNWKFFNLFFMNEKFQGCASWSLRRRKSLLGQKSCRTTFSLFST